jgi:hypothetical protein
MTGKEKRGLLAIVILAAVVPATAWRAYALVRAWDWFVVPLGVTPIGLWHAAGISMIVKFLAQKNDEDDIDDDAWIGKKLRQLALWAVGPAWVLGIGYLMHSCMGVG